MGHLLDLHLSFQYVSGQLTAEWVSKILAKTCAKAIIDSTKRDDTYLTAPSWMKTAVARLKRFSNHKEIMYQ